MACVEMIANRCILARMANDELSPQGPGWPVWPERKATLDDPADETRPPLSQYSAEAFPGNMVEHYQEQATLLRIENLTLHAQLGACRDEVEQLTSANVELTGQTMTDRLMGIGSLQMLEEEYPRLFQEHPTRRDDEAPPAWQSEHAALVIDLDNFSQVNNTYGHSFGNQVLKEVGRRLAENTRRRDIVGRFGGEEFVVVMPRTRVDQAFDTARKLLAAISEEPMGDPPIQVTASIGIGPLLPGNGIADGIRIADAAMYQAKKGGRDQIAMIFSADEIPPSSER